MPTYSKMPSVTACCTQRGKQRRNVHVAVISNT